MLRTYLYLVELIRAEIHHMKPEEKPEDVKWEHVFKLAHEHMVVSLAFDSVSKLQKKPEGALYQQWKEFSDKALVKEISFDAERIQILQAFEQEEIKYVPLKGIILKAFYDRPGLRQFSDNDILIERERIADAGRIMIAHGYEENETTEYHVEYLKKPIYNFELHTQLLPEKNANYGYYADIWQRLEKDEENSGGYHMTKLDFYLYHILHLEKHFGEGGTGLRYFVDQYYLEKDVFGELDRQVLEEKLEKLKMQGFESKIHGLTSVLFGSANISWQKLLDSEPEYLEMFQYVMSCGAYGNSGIMAENRIKKYGSKWKYFVSRLTTEDVYYKSQYPILKKIPWLKPVFIMWRLVSAPFKKTDKVKAEFKALFGKK